MRCKAFKGGEEDQQYRRLVKKVVLPSGENLSLYIFRDDTHPGSARRRQRLGGQRGRLPGRVWQRERPGGPDVLRPQTLSAEGEEKDPGGRGLRGHERGVEGDGSPRNLQGSRRLSSKGEHRSLRSVLVTL